jgi:class 3 adenylate cyclase/tetratricopeptide (TPR) repeat protein
MVHEERRIVTVLFADLAGYTALAEHLDPEQVKRLMSGCFERLVDDVNGFGGSVDKILGDGILALFGAPVAHEDDPERAVRAGLRMHHTLSSYATEADLGGYGDFRLRVGINTGEVLVGKLAGSDYTALGDVVNTAQRLQAAAPVGGVLVGPLTHSLTSYSIRYDEGRRLQPKGRDQEIDAHLAIEALSRPGAARPTRRLVRLIGRDAELSVARAALDAVPARRSVLVAISGDNGVGTSRVLDELVRYMREAHHAVTYAAAGVPYGESNVWWPVAFAIFRSFEIEPGTSVDIVRPAIGTRSELLGARWTPEERDRVVDGLLHVLGYPSPIDELEPEPARQAIRHAVTQAFELRTRRHPVVLAIDDFHWVDPGIIDLVGHLLHALHQQPFAVLTAARLGFHLEWPPKSERFPVVSVPLEPLSRADTDLLAGELLGEGASVRRLAELYERSGGNPLFLQELAALTEQTGEHHDLPATLRSLVAARLDQLTRSQRRTVDNAATLGNSGAVHDLGAFALELGQEFSEDDVRALDEAGILDVRDGRWRFRSESVRDAAYQTLTKSVRAQRHAGIAAALQRMGDDYRVDDLAHHLATTAELVVDLGGLSGLDRGIVDEAIERLRRTAERALSRGNLVLAARQATRALDLLDAGEGDDIRRMPLLLLRASSRAALRDFVAALPDIEAAMAIALRIGDLAAEGEARRLRGNVASAQSDRRTARAELDRAIALLRTAGQLDGMADAVRSRGWIELFGGSVVAAQRYFDEAESLYREAGNERGLAWVGQHRAWAAFLAGDMRTARQLLSEAQEAFARLGDHNGLGWAGGILAFIAFFERNFEEAERLAVTVGEGAEQRGDEWSAGIMQVLLANLALWEQARPSEAERLANVAIRRLSLVSDQWGTVQALSPLVRAEIALGRTAEMQRTIEHLRELSLADTNGTFPHLALAGAAMHRGRGAEALDYVQRTTQQMESRHMVFDDVHAIRVVALVQQRRVFEALAHLRGFPKRLVEHPFGAAAAALAHSVARHATEAQAAGEVAIAAHGRTYLDETLAYIALGNAAGLQDDPARAELCLEAAVARSLGAGDVVAIALATEAFARVVGRSHPAGGGGPLGRGWERVVSQLTPLAATARI